MSGNGRVQDVWVGQWFGLKTIRVGNPTGTRVVNLYIGYGAEASGILVNILAIITIAMAEDMAERMANRTRLPCTKHSKLPYLTYRSGLAYFALPLAS